MRNIDHSNYEEWLFEYFEGSLSMEEKKQVLEFIQRDPLYQDEFNYWEKTYIREPLPPKLKIESSLLRNQDHSNYRQFLTTLAILLLLGGASSIYFNNKGEETKSSFNNKEIENTAAFVPQQKITGEENTQKKRVQPSKKVKVKKESIVMLPLHNDKLVADTTAEKTALPDQPTLQHPEKDSLLSLEETIIIDSTTQVQPKPVAAPLSKKEVRQRRKYFEKLKEKERAKKLQKGKLPYIVPLDPNTF
jgi:hypothetical protein